MRRRTPLALMALRWFTLVFTASLVMGCVGAPPTIESGSNATPNFGYVPFDPLPVRVSMDAIQPPSDVKYNKVLWALPDETVRIAMAKFDGKLGLTYGVAKADAEAGSYRVILDYMKFTTANTKLYRQLDEQGFATGRYRLYNEQNDRDPPVIVPVYVGCGLRIVAEVTVYGGSVNLGSLFALGAAAEAKQVRGTLMVQSLGIGGQEISGAIPMPSEINQTTIANAITALATIKSKLYDEKTTISPRVLGIYNTIGGDASTVNSLIGTLLTNPPEIPLSVNMRDIHNNTWHTAWNINDIFISPFGKWDGLPLPPAHDPRLSPDKVEPPKDWGNAPPQRNSETM